MRRAARRTATQGFKHMDMSPFVIPKSDQLNADDLLTGPRTIRITRVSGTGASDQPVAVYFDGDDGKPFKPCKSMRRVMIAAWGVDTSQYAGRTMTLYRDPKVVFGGMEVGGIRISHMSHIDKPLAMALTVTKAKRAPYRVSPLSIPAAPPGGAPAPAAVSSSDERNDDPSDAGGSGGGAWDRGGAKSAERQIALKNASNEVRYFATVADWCMALAEIVDGGADGKTVWKANIKISDALRQRGSAMDIGNLDAARDYALSDTPLINAG